MNKRTALIGVLLVVAAVVLFVVLSGGKDDEENLPVGDGGSSAAKSDSAKPEGPQAQAGGEKQSQPQVPKIVVGKDGKPVGGIVEITVSQGDEVRFEVESAVGDEIHVHGYDLMKDVPAGGTVQFAFPAEIEGIFEAELEGRGEQILELKVEP